MINNKIESVRVNADLPRILAEISNLLGIKFIQISTDHFESATDQVRDELVQAIPVNQYGVTKLQAEEFVSNFESSIIIRTNFFGWSTASRQNSFWNLFQALTQRKPYTGFEDINYTPISVVKLIDTIIYLINIDFAGLINISGTDNLSKYDFAKFFAKKLNIADPIILKGTYGSSENSVLRPKNMGLVNTKLLRIVPREGFDLSSNFDYILKQLSNGVVNRIGSIH